MTGFAKPAAHDQLPQVPAQDSAGPAAGPAEAESQQWDRIPQALRDRAQWCLASPTEKRPRQVDGRPASSTDPTTWIDFETASRAAADRGWHLGYAISEADPYACIDLDVKPDTTAEQQARFHHIISSFDSFTEHSRSGNGFHVWVEGRVGKGGRRDGIEIYSQGRFMICTGNVVHNKPIMARQELLEILHAEIKKAEGPEVEWQDDSDGDQDWHVAQQAFDDQRSMGKLFREGDWKALGYPSQSEADFALVKDLARLTTSNKECWRAFRLSALGKREKATRQDYARSTLAAVRRDLAKDAADAAYGSRIVEGWFSASRSTRRLGYLLTRTFSASPDHVGS